MRHGETHVTCPDCFGKKFLTVTLGDGVGSIVTIDCGTCSVGYDPPSGIIRLPTYTAELTTVRIDSVITKLVNEQEICLYSGDSMYETPESDLFLIEEIQAATERADALAKEHTEEEAKRMLRKEKDTRTWAWNICYHRRQIKEAERQLAYHRAKLEAAAVHRKEKE
jgi:hypothetical protein